eukprot:COSAG06_NODE_17145_length_959_cov_0.894186_1_plen_308_part_10
MNQRYQGEEHEDGSKIEVPPGAQLSGPRRVFFSSVALYCILALATAFQHSLRCPPSGTAPWPALTDAGSVSVGWVTIEEASMQPDWAEVATPECTNLCDRQDDGCNDGGTGSSLPFFAGSSLPFFDHEADCALGSHTSACGCRSGTAVADWIDDLVLPEEYGWGDRLGQLGCFNAVLFEIVGLSILCLGSVPQKTMVGTCCLCVEVGACGRLCRATLPKWHDQVWPTAIGFVGVFGVMSRLGYLLPAWLYMFFCGFWIVGCLPCCWIAAIHIAKHSCDWDEMEWTEQTTFDEPIIYPLFTHSMLLDTL